MQRPKHTCLIKVLDNLEEVPVKYQERLVKSILNE